MEKWYKKSFYRNLVDMHIPDDDPTYLSKFDAEEYARLVAESGVDTAILYASNCLGLTFFEEEQMHGNMNGRDFVGERIDAFKRYGVRTILYYNIWNREAATRHPEWRLVNPYLRKKDERFRRCCLNAEGFRAYVKRQLESLSHRYSFEGIWIDMIDWFDTLCVCPSCRARLMREDGIEIPERVDFCDVNFAKFRAARERWLCDFIDLVRDAVHSGNPEATVTLQNAAWRRGLDSGISEESVRRSEFLAGDFYAQPLAYSVICKLLNNASANRPIEFMTSVCSQLEAHTTSKTDKELLRTIYGSLAHNTAFTFIDAIDPVGTMNESRYLRMKRIGERTARERSYIAPDARLVSDLTIYLNHDSMFEFVNVAISDYRFGGTIAPKLTNMAEMMIDAGIAYDINVRKNLDSIDTPVMLIPDQRILNEREKEAICRYVEGGGRLIVTASTGTLGKDGVKRDDFLLSELLGVHYIGESGLDRSYLRRADPGVAEFGDYDEGYPVAVCSGAVLVRADEGVEILAYLTNPVSSSTDPDRFSSAISDPPMIDTDYPAITRRRVGKGEAIYIATTPEGSLHADGRGLFTSLISMNTDRQIKVECPGWMEVLTYLDEKNHRYLVSCLNTMSGGYEATVPEVKISIRTDKAIKCARNVTTDADLTVTHNGGRVDFVVRDVDSYAMVVLEY